MQLKNGLTFIIFYLFSIVLVACGGGGSGNSNGGNTPDPDPTPPTSGKLVIQDSASADNKPVPLRNIPYSTAPSNAAQRNGTTSIDGSFEYMDAESVTFNLLGISIGPISARAIITENELADSLCKDATAPISCTHNTSKNIQRTLLSIDDDENYANGINLLAGISAFPLPLDSSPDNFELALGKMLLAEQRQVAAVFQPSLGINLEEPQPEADDVGGQPIPFVDLFRIGRPFPEYSCSDIVYDEHGWPTDIPASCAEQEHPVLRVASYATTLIARFAPLGSLPSGKYTVFYEGSGTIQYSGIATKLNAESSTGRDIIEMTPQLLKDRASAGLRIQIKTVDAEDPIKNIRIIMPGGTCENNPFIRVESAEECPVGLYRSFAERFEQDRNAMVFNPDFLRFLKDFKVIRTMNFMKASPRNPCYAFSDEAYFECILQDFTWDQRAKMDDAMWGGSFRTDLIKRANRGVPLEVTVELANQLKRDPWFNLPHNATDDFIKQYATYVRDNLDSSLKAYVEYTNEPWNGPFWANPYVIEKGKAAGLDQRDYWAGIFYYSQRAVEVFTIWQEVWGGTERLVRTVNTQHNGGEFASRNMLSHKGASQSIDALASAPYFYGCWNRASSRCQDEEKIPKVIKDVTSVDEIFDIIDNPNNPYGIDSTVNYVKIQAEVAKEFNVDLIAYEGGQHLTVSWGDQTIETARKNNLRNLFEAANRDSRMGNRYSQLLNGWKREGGKLFSLYTLPQTYHAFGSFGIKEYLNQPRDDAPKYDMSMRFQENQRKCWWEGC